MRPRGGGARLWGSRGAISTLPILRRDEEVLRVTLQRDFPGTWKRWLVGGCGLRGRGHPPIRLGRAESVKKGEYGPAGRLHEHGAEDVHAGRDHPPRQDAVPHRQMAMGTIGLVANDGGQTMARVLTETHSQMTPIAFMFSPARGSPEGANRRPLPLGSVPTGSRTLWAAAATPSAERLRALGRT